MLKAYLSRLQTAFTYKFIFILFILQCFIKGVVFVIMSEGMLPLFKSMGIDAVQLQVLGALALSPWTVKPLIGVMSDLIAMDGYHKKYWMLFSILIGVFSGIWLVIDIRVPVMITMFIAGVHFEIAVCDLLIEAQYAKLMRENPNTGSDIVTLSTGFQQLGFIIGMCFIGPLADLGLFRVSNIIALFLLITPIIPVLLNWMRDERRPDNPPYILLDTKRLKVEWKVILVVSLTGISAPAMGAITAFSYKWLGLLCSLVIITLACIGGFAFMPHPLIGRVALYQVLAQASRISFSSALDYFFTADINCLPNGPHFEYKFYITVAGIVGAITGFVSVFIYQLLFSKWKYRNVLLFTTILSGLGGLFDFIIVMRWNVSWGIPDSVFFLIGDDVLHTVVELLYWIPSSSIIGKVCPKHMESSVYAYLAGISNFGKMIAVIAGAMMTEWAGIQTIQTRFGYQNLLVQTTKCTQCNFANLEWLVLGGHIVCMLLISIPASFLIPNVAQDVDLIGREEKVKEEILQEEAQIELNDIEF